MMLAAVMDVLIGYGNSGLYTRTCVEQSGKCIDYRTTHVTSLVQVHLLVKLNVDLQ